MATTKRHNAYHDARGEGGRGNHKKIQRPWRQEGLRGTQKRRRKRPGTSTAPNLSAADAPNTVWGRRRLPVRRHD